MGLFQQEYWSRWPFSPPGDFPNPGIVTPALAGRFFTTELPGKPPGLCSLAAKYDPLTISLLSFSYSVVSYSLQTHGLQHARPPCPSPSPRVYSNSCPSSQWCHPTISSSIIPFSYCLQSFPASGSFQMSQFFASGGQNIEVWASASVFPMNIQGWFPLRLTADLLAVQGTFESLL